MAEQQGLVTPNTEPVSVWLPGDSIVNLTHEAAVHALADIPGAMLASTNPGKHYRIHQEVVEVHRARVDRLRAGATPDTDAPAVKVWSQATQYSVCAVPRDIPDWFAWEIRVEQRSPGRWAVTRFGQCLSTTGEWDYESIPSEREDECHHQPRQGYLFAAAVADEAGTIVGVATVGRPSARALQDGWTCEVTRTCTDGTRNANSALYGAAWRAARALGYRRCLTYTQDGEAGSSLRAAGWQPAAALPPRPGWDTPGRRRDNDLHPTEIGRTRWEIAAASPPWAVRPRIPMEAAGADQPALFEEAS
jgi:hypothetical protein